MPRAERGLNTYMEKCGEKAVNHYQVVQAPQKSEPKNLRVIL